MSIQKLQTPRREFGQTIPVAPDTNAEVAKINELVEAVNAGLGVSNAVVGGPKFVRFVDSKLYGVSAQDLTLDQLDASTILPGNLATVINPADNPTSDTLPPRQYVATLVADGTPGAVAVPAYAGATDTVLIGWQAAETAAAFTPLLASELTKGKEPYAGLALHPLLVKIVNAIGEGVTTVITQPATPAPMPAPTLTGYLPGSGAVGASVTLTGTNFTKATAVTFNGTAASFQVLNATTIVAVVPPNATTGQVSVTTPGGTATSTASFTVNATATPTPALTAALALSLAQITLGGSVGYSISPSGGTPPYSYEVVATDLTTGTTYALGSAKSGTWQPPVADQYQVDATVTDSSSPAKVVEAATRYLNVVAAVNRIPVADAGSDLTIQLPTSSAELMGRATDPDNDAITGHAWRQVTGPNSATGMPASTQNVVVSGLVAGTYQFGYVATDARGGLSAEDYVLVTVQAAGAPSITSASPDGAPVGTEVSISGANFGDTQGNGNVKFNGVLAQIKSWAAKLIVVVIPSAATTGPLAVTTDSGASTAVNYTVQVNNALTEIDIPEAAWQCSTQSVDRLGGKHHNTFAYIEFDTFATQLDLQGITELGTIGYADQASFGVFVGTPDNIGLPGTFSQNAQFGGSRDASPTPIWIGLTGITGSGTKRIRVMLPADSRNGASTQNILATILLKLRANAPVSFVTNYPASDTDYFIGEDSIASSQPANFWTESWPLRLRNRLRGVARVLVNSVAGASLVEFYGSVGTPDKAGYRQQFASSATNATNIFIYGANDAGRLNVSATDFGTAYGNLLDDLHAQNSAARQVIVTPFTTRDFEDRLAPLRAKVADVVSARSSWAQKFDGPRAFAGIPGPSKAGDPDDGAGIHPGTVQHASIENYIWGLLNGVDPNLFSDDFPGTVLNQRWNAGLVGQPTDAAVVVVNNSLQITATVGPGHQQGVTSALPYSLLAYAFQTKIGSLFVVRPESVQYLGFHADGDSILNGYQFVIGNGRLVFLGPKYVQLANIAYSTTNHKYVRFRGVNSSVIPETSPDGVTWTNPFGVTDTASFSLANVRLIIGGGGTSSTDANWPTGKSLGTATFLNAGITLNSGSDGGTTPPAQESVLLNADFTDPLASYPTQGWLAAAPIGNEPYYQAGGSASIANGVGTVDSSNWLVQTPVLIANAVYKLELTVSSITAGYAEVSGPGAGQINTFYGNSSTGAAPGVYSQTFTSTGGKSVFAARVNGAGTATLDKLTLTRLS